MDNLKISKGESRQSKNNIMDGPKLLNIIKYNKNSSKYNDPNPYCTDPKPNRNDPNHYRMHLSALVCTGLLLRTIHFQFFIPSTFISMIDKFWSYLITTDGIVRLLSFLKDVLEQPFGPLTSSPLNCPVSTLYFLSFGLSRFADCPFSVFWIV